MHIAICDDDIQDCKRIKSYLDNTAHQIYVYTATEDMLLAMDRGNHFDLLLLDIEMPKGMSGMEAAQYLRSKNNDVMIVFITNHSAMMGEAFPVDAIDFLVKPVEAIQLQKVIRRCVYKHDNNNYLVFSSNVADITKTNEILSLRSKDIYYITSQKNYSFIYHRLSPEPFKLRITIGRLVKELQQFASFYRCQSGYIINWQYVFKLYREKDYSCWAWLKDDQWEAHIPISRKKWQEATLSFHQYHRGEL